METTKYLNTAFYVIFLVCLALVILYLLQVANAHRWVLIVFSSAMIIAIVSVILIAYDDSNDSKKENLDMDKLKADITAKFELLEKEIKGSSGSLNGRLTALENVTSVIGATVATYSSSIKTLQNLTNDLEGRIGATDDSVKNLGGTLTGISSKLDGTISEVTSLSGVVTKMDSVVTKVDGRLAAMDVKITDTNEKLLKLAKGPVNIDFTMLALPPTASVEYQWYDIKHQTVPVVANIQQTNETSDWVNPGDTTKYLSFEYKPLQEGRYTNTTSSRVLLVNEMMPTNVSVPVQVVKLQNEATISDDLERISNTTNLEDYQKEMGNFWSKHPLDSAWGQGPVQLSYQVGELLRSDINPGNNTNTTIEYINSLNVDSIIKDIIGSAGALLSFIPLVGATTAAVNFVMSTSDKISTIAGLFGLKYKSPSNMAALPYAGRNGFVEKYMNVNDRTIVCSTTEIVDYVKGGAPIINMPPNGGRTPQNTAVAANIPPKIIEGKWVNAFIVVGAGYDIRLRNTLKETPMMVQFPYTHIYGESVEGRGIGSTYNMGKTGLLKNALKRGPKAGDSLAISSFAYAQYGVEMTITDEDGLVDVFGKQVPVGWNCVLLNGSNIDPIYPEKKNDIMLNVPPAPGWGMPVATFDSVRWSTFAHDIINMNQ